MTQATNIPAILGGPAIRPQGPPPWPIADPDVEQALLAAYHDGSWGAYNAANAERLVAWLREYHAVDHAVLLGSGTFAVEVALRAVGVEAGDEVIQAAYDYPGNFLSIHAVQALPLLVNVAPTDWNLAPAALADAVGAAYRAILVSHLHGGLVPMREIMAFAQERGLPVIEDAAQCPGALVQEKRAGAWGDVGILSFGGSKLLSAGRGGALFTPHEKIIQRARTVLQRGNNLVCPLSELQAAVLLPQMRKLDERNDRRRRAVHRLATALKGVPGLAMFDSRLDNSRPGFYKLGFQYDAGRFGLRRDVFVAAMRAEGIGLDEGFAALHAGRSPRRYRQGSTLVEADRAHEGTVILHHPVLLGEDTDIDEVAAAARKIWSQRERFHHL